jgi:hypothetical protein
VGNDRFLLQPGKLEAMAELTRSQVNKAGKTLRVWWTDQLMMTPEVEAAIEVLWQWRASHQYPLIKANNGLRSMVRTEGCQIEVSQRLKRVPTIIDKLSRQPAMQLATMQDLGGCRAVLDSVDEVRRVERRLRRNRAAVKVNDYIAQPRDSGYRSLHVIVRYDERLIEMQLRTRVMHEWAIAVERLSGRVGQDLKSGRGPDPVLAWLAAVSEAMAAEEGGETVPQDLLATISRLRVGANEFMARR